MSLESETFSELRKNLPSEPVEPSAPIYESITARPDPDERMQKKEEKSVIFEEVHFSARAGPGDRVVKDEIATASDSVEESLNIMKLKLQYKLDLQTARLKKEHLEKEWLIVNEDFKNRIASLDVEIATALSQIESLKNRSSPSPNTSLASNAMPQNQNSSAAGSSVHRYPPVSPPLGFRVNETNVRLSGIGSPVPPSVPPTVSPTIGLTTSTCVGLEQLRVLDTVSIRQLRSRDNLDETYEVVAPGEDLVIFRVNVTVRLSGTHMVFNLDFVDNEFKEVVTFKGRHDRCMELYVCGQLACFVKKAPTFLKPMLLICDHLEKPVLKLKGMTNGGHSKNMFQIQTANKLNIGKYHKLPKEPSPLYEANHSVCEFPLDLDVRFKAAIIATSFLVVDEKTSALRARKMVTAVENITRAINDQNSRDYPRV